MSSRIRRSADLEMEPIRWPSAAGSPWISLPNPGAAKEGTRAVASSAQPIAARDSHSQIDQKIQAAYAQGLQEGATTGRREVDAQVRVVAEKLARSIDEITGLRERLRHKAEEDVVALAIAIARRILHREIAIDPQVLVGLTKAALE